MAHDPYYRQMLEWSKQQAAQQAQRQQEQVNIQRINEERERLRREHLERIRIYEAQVANAAAASSSAAGAGAGAGGGSRRPTGIDYGNVVTGQTELFIYAKSDTYHYVILDYTHNKITPETDTTISSLEFSINEIMPIQETGYFIEFTGDTTYHLFINDNGQPITKFETGGSISYLSNNDMVFSYVTTETNYNCYAFDGQEVSQFDIDFGGEGTNFSLIKGPAVYISKEDYGSMTRYIWSKESGLVTLESVNSPYDANSKAGDSANFVITSTYPAWSQLKVWDSLTGNLKSTVSLTASHPTGAAYYSGYLGLYGTNKAYGLFFDSNSTTPYLLKNYNGDTNTWTSMTHSKANYPTCNLTSNVGSGSEAVVNLSYPIGSTGVFNSPGEVLLAVFCSSQLGSPNFYIDLHAYCDIVWSIDGSTFSSYTLSTNQPTRGLNMNDDSTGSFNGDGNTVQYFGKTMFLQALLGDGNFSLLNFGAATYSVIPVTATASINQGQFNQGWAAFRAGDRFGIIYGNKTPARDVVKMYSSSGTLLQTATMSGTTTSILTLNDNAQGNLAIVDDNNVGIEYVWNLTTGGTASFATYSRPGWTSTSSMVVYKTADSRTPSGLVRYTSSTFRIYTDTSVSSIITTTYAIGTVVVAEDFIVIQDYNAPITYYVYDMTGTLINTVHTSDTTQSDFYAVGNRVFAVTNTGSVYNAYYISATDYHTQVISSNYSFMSDDVVFKKQWNNWC